MKMERMTAGSSRECIALVKSPLEAAWSAVVVSNVALNDPMMQRAVSTHIADRCKLRSLNVSMNVGNEIIGPTHSRTP